MPYAYDGPPDRHAFFLRHRWVIVGGGLLAFIAGYINVVLLGYYHVPVSHMSGAVSRLSMDLQDKSQGKAWQVLGIIGGFLAGAVISGFFIDGRRPKPTLKYSVLLLLESAILFIAAWLLNRNMSVGVAMASMACGLQNAMTSSFFGLITRTTHVTGIVTDLGVLIGQAIRDRMVETWKLVVLGSLLIGFFGGGLAGAYSLSKMGMKSLFLAGAATALGAVIYWRGFGYWNRRKNV
ncbi:MAG: hypothetical protein JWM04_66 [Verrucomicrobiales bacterium]|nr:hypothetical protein [Verrucomicrobiales bacterium]